MQTLREVAVKIFFSADPRPLDELNKSFTDLTKSIGLASLSVGAIFGGLVKTVEATSHFADETEKVSKRLGLGVEEFQKFAYAAKQTGDVSQEELVPALSHFVKVIGDAATGSKEARKNLATAGVDFAVFGDRLPTTGEALALVSERLKGIKNPAIQASVAADLFGRIAGPKLVGSLSVGADELARLGLEAEKAGAILGLEAIEAGAKFDKQLKKISASTKTLGRTIGAALLPVASELLESFNKLITESKGDLVKELAGAFEGLAHYVKIAGKFLFEVLKSINAIVRSIGGWKTLVKLVATFAAIWVSGSILASIGSTAAAVVTLINALNKAKIAAVALNLAMAAIPALIGAAFVAIGLIIEDIYRFFSGENSLLGVILGKDKGAELIKTVEGFFFMIFNWADIAAQKIKGIFGGVASFLGFGPTEATAARSSETNSSVANNQSNQFSADLTLNVGAGSSATEVAKGAQEGIEAAFQNMLKSSSFNLKEQRAY